MSIIFGVLSAASARVTEIELLELSAATRAMAAEGTFVRSHRRLGMGYQPLSTNSASPGDLQPMGDADDNLAVMDGRIDNRRELRDELGIHDPCATDTMLILAGFRSRGEEFFARIRGEWALALWWEETGTLYLVRDHAGTRTLFFERRAGRLRFSTSLETFFGAGATPPLDEVWAAAYLASIPAGDRTPYEWIRAVPPAHLLAVRGDSLRAVRHFDPLAVGRIRYRRDREYEDHLFQLFRQAVSRRTAVGDPILAQLSGGMDSASIVCMSDHIRRSEGYSAGELLDTVSYISPSEPDWNEEPYIAAVESARGKSGIHLEASFSERMVEPAPPEAGEQLVPGITAAVVDFQVRLRTLAGEGRYRVILSGVGGDEVLGGVPTPGPGLADELFRLRLSRLFPQALDWATSLGCPMLSLLGGTVRFGLELYLPRLRPTPPVPLWLTARLRRLALGNRSPGALVARISCLPSALSNARTWSAVLGTLPHLWPLPGPRFEYRYPCLDRDLVDFLFSIPRDQLVRPGQRRSLMRRALYGLVPEMVLERRRKAYISRGPQIALRDARSKIEALFADPILARSGWVDPAPLRRAAEAVVSGREPNLWPQLMRAVTMELWLQSRQ